MQHIYLTIFERIPRVKKFNPVSYFFNSSNTNRSTVSRPAAGVNDDRCALVNDEGKVGAGQSVAQLRRLGWVANIQRSTNTADYRRPTTSAINTNELDHHERLRVGCATTVRETVCRQASCRVERSTAVLAASSSSLATAACSRLYKTFVSRPRTRPRLLLHDQTRQFFCHRGASGPRPRSRGLYITGSIT